MLLVFPSWSAATISAIRDFELAGFHDCRNVTDSDFFGAEIEREIIRAVRYKRSKHWFSPYNASRAHGDLDCRANYVVAPAAVPVARRGYRAPLRLSKPKRIADLYSVEILQRSHKHLYNCSRSHVSIQTSTLSHASQFPWNCLDRRCRHQSAYLATASVSAVLRPPRAGPGQGPGQPGSLRIPAGTRSTRHGPRQ
jgi:hypothetical protein